MATNAMVVFIWPLVNLSFSKNNHFSPPLDSLCSWVLSARSEEHAYYTVEAVPSTQWRKSILSSDLHIWLPMVVFDQPLGWFMLVDLSLLKTNLFSLPLNSLHTIFPLIVSAETILFWKWKMWKFSYSFRIMAIFYFINWIVAAETIEGGKLFAEIR